MEKKKKTLINKTFMHNIISTLLVFVAEHRLVSLCLSAALHVLSAANSVLKGRDSMLKTATTTKTTHVLHNKQFVIFFVAEHRLVSLCL